MKLVLAGNPNSGKTSLFNYLTGSRQHVGNWPGVTVDRKEGIVKIDGKEHTLVDLPGIYALDADTIEQRISRDFILSGEAGLIINILDATNLRRNLYFTLQLRETGVPMVIALNMMDEVEKSGAKIDMGLLSKALGAPVTGISASKGIGIDKLFSLIKDFDNGKIEEKPLNTGCRNCGMCSEGEMRYHMIDGIISACVSRPEKKKNGVTQKIDRIVLNKYLAFPIFILIMLAVFMITFGWLTSEATAGIDFLLNNVIAAGLKHGLDAVNAAPPLISLVCDGIIPGVGTVLSFLPQIAVLFILMSFLEDSGYMARAAILMDRIFSLFGLSGSSFIPLIMGFGCAVPAVMACRILPTERDRRLTVTLSTFVSCSARLPVYVLMTGMFFSRFQGPVIMSIYVLGICVAILTALVLNKTVLKQESGSFVMELPPYRLPAPRNLIMHTWEKVKGFLVKAGTVLLAVSVIIWFLQSFTPDLRLTARPDVSLLSYIGRFIAPIFKPLGFGNWQAATALLAGAAAKETLVSTFSVLNGGNLALLHKSLASIFTPLSAFSFMAFVLFYTPCISALATMKKEFNSAKWSWGTAALDFSVAWIVSFLIYNVGMLISKFV